MIYKNNDLTKVEFDKGLKEFEDEFNQFGNEKPAEAECLKNLLGYLKKMNAIFVPGATQEQRFELEYLAECFACSVREITARISQKSKKEIMVKCAENMGLTVEKKDGILEVTLPMILPTKAKGKAAYLFEPLFFAMEDFSKNEPLFIKEKAMMCIEFIYDKNNKNIKRGDHDNKEVKQVIDAISAFVVPDDSDEFLSLCQISSEGEYNHTKVYVMPERSFSTFFLDHSKKHLKYRKNHITK